MRSRLFEIMVASAVMLALWVVPSGGLQGRDALGRMSATRAQPADRHFVAADARGTAVLAAADAVAARAVAGLMPQSAQSPHR